MKPNPPTNPAQPQSSRRHPLLLAVVAFALGIGLTGFWFHSHLTGLKNSGLSASTKNLLGQLAAPVTIRYYSILPAGSADETLQAFSGRVAQLLEAVQAAGDGKILLTTIDAPAETNATAADADGIQAFNLEKGAACFLGLDVASGKNQETFARLQPEWEPALEYDLARAILRVTAAAAPARMVPEAAKPSQETIATINRLIPDVSAVSVEQADQLFHAEFLRQCGEVGSEMETQVKAAQEQMVQAQNIGSPADLEAARKNLLQVQLAQGDKYKALAAQLQLQLAAFQQLKAGTNNTAK